MFSKLLLWGMMLAVSAQATLQTPVAQNYSSETLRLAKAAQIKAYLGAEQDPCDDFYEFACEKWRRLQPAARISKKTSYLEQLEELYVNKCAEMLQDARLSDTSVEVKLKDFYASCRNQQALEQLGTTPVLNVVELKGGWPVINSPTWYEYEYDWLKVIADLRRKLGVDILVGLDVIPDFEDKDMHRIKVGAPKLGLGSKEAYLSSKYEKRRDKYKEGIEHKLHKYFSAMPKVWAKEVAAQVLDVEQQLAKGLPDNANLSVKQTTRQRYAAELKAAYGNYVDLSRYLNLIFNQTIYIQVYETPEDYMSNLVEVIKQTPKLTIANYTMWRVLEKFNWASVTDKAANANWCVRDIMEYFPHQLESMFHHNYNNMLVINELQSVWADIKRAYREELQNSNQLNWITTDTRQKAVQKLEAMELKTVAHDEKSLEEQVKGIVVRKEKYYQNLINIMQWQTQLELAKLVEKPRSNEAEVAVHLPKYQLAENKILVPITFLQARFFWDSAYPHALKYSSLGTILAQEMLHGFDVVGRKYDKHGYQRSWWDAQSQTAFDERASCFTKQYAKYSYHGAEGDDALNSIADQGGLVLAYQAYQQWWQNANNQDVSTQETLPLLNYTQNQIFFIGYAQLWCADYPPTATNQPAATSSSERWRVNGALVNFQAFAKEFSCAARTKMNPDQKCGIY